MPLGHKQTVKYFWALYLIFSTVSCTHKYKYSIEAETFDRVDSIENKYNIPGTDVVDRVRCGYRTFSEFRRTTIECKGINGG